MGAVEVLAKALLVILPVVPTSSGAVFVSRGVVIALHSLDLY